MRLLVLLLCYCSHYSVKGGAITFVFGQLVFRYLTVRNGDSRCSPLPWENAEKDI